MSRNRTFDLRVNSPSRYRLGCVSVVLIGMQVNFSANYPLHRSIQCVVDGKQQRSETSFNKLDEAR